MESRRQIRMLTTGMHVFPVLRRNEKAKYVDKTALLHTLCNDVDQQLFISRPRRFGKSLMLSTLKAMFECRRELFEGLAIDSLPWEWDKPFPVLDFTMASATGTTYEDFRGNLRGLVKRLATNHDVAFNDGETTEKNFEDMIQAVANKSDRKQAGERQSARGRADAILKDKNGVYVFEFKYSKTAGEALEQARTKDYAGPWLDGDPPVFLVGVNYDPEKRGIDDPLVEPA